MSDRDFIIQEIRKLFKEQEEPSGILQQLAGKDLLNSPGSFKYKGVDFSIKFHETGMVVGLNNSNLNFTFHLGPIDLKVYEAKVEGSGSSANLKMGIWIDKRQAQVSNRDLESWLPKLLAKRPVVINAAGKKITIKPSSSNPVIDLTKLAPPKKQKQPAKSVEKVMPAKDARSTEDLPFQQINIPSEYQQQYQQVTAGMDRGETGECPFINQAAIKVLGDDPKVIYTALINSGVLPANYVPPSKPCEGLGELIRNFQYLATQGKLRYQKKIDPTGDITKKLAYKPEVPTPDLQKQAATAIAQQKGPTIKQQQIAKRAGGVGPQKPTQVVKNPVRKNLQEQKVSVDGKIGSRTAALLKIYANKESFEQLKKKAGVEPKPAPKPAPKPEPKKQQKANCQVTFRSVKELLNKTALAVMGVHYCSLDAKYNLAIGGEQWRSLAGSILSGEDGPSAGKYIQNSKEVAAVVKKNLSNKQTGLASYAVKDNEEEKGKIYGNKYPWLKSVLDNSFSDKLFKFYSGIYNKQNIIGFSLVKVGGQVKPIVYSYSGDKDSEYHDVAQYYKGLNYNKWITTPAEKRADTFQVDSKASSSIQSINRLVDLHFGSLREYSKILKAIKDPMGEIENNSDAPIELEKCKDMVDSYLKMLQNFKAALNEFMSNTSEESLENLIGSAGTISVAQRSTIHGDSA